MCIFPASVVHFNQKYVHMYDIEQLNQLNSREIVQRLLGDPLRRSSNYDKYYSPFRADGRRAGLTVYANGIKDYGGEGQYWTNISFVMDVLNCSFAEACAWLGGESQQIPQVEPQARVSRTEPPSRDWQTIAFRVVNDSEHTLWNTLEGQKALAYLRRDRGLTDTTIRKYRLGYNPTWQTIRIAGEQTKLAPGIIIPWIIDDEIFAVRIRTPQGSLSSYTGHDARYFEGKDKYLSLKGSRQSAGLFGAVDGLNKVEHVTILEGEFDAMLFGQLSASTAITRGSAGDHRHISSQWLEQLQQIPVVYGLLDADEAGQGASNTLFETLPNFVPLKLPFGKDFSEYVTHYKGDVTSIWGQIEHATREAEARRQTQTKEEALTERDNIPMSDWARWVALAPLAVDLCQNLDYISDIDLSLIRHQRSVLVKSPLGTGKTELIKRMIADFEQENGRSPKILYLTSTVALVENSAKRLNLDTYRDVPEGSSVPFEQVACSLNSAPQLQTKQFDIVVFDELESGLHYLATSGTMKSDNLNTAYKGIKTRIQQAGQFIGLDAHLSDLSRSIIEEWLGDTFTVQNQRESYNRKMTFHRKRESVLQAALRKARADVGTVVITTNSKDLTYTYYDVFAQELGEEAVVIINGDNSAGETARELLKDIDNQLDNIRVLIVSPSVRNGFDIQTEVAGVYGVFLSHTPADSIMQMMMRCRNARTRHLYVAPVFEGQAETDSNRILARYLKQAELTARAAKFETYGLHYASDTQTEIAEIAALFGAEHNRQRNDLFSFAVAYAKAEGFSIQYDESEAEAMRKRLQEARTAYKARKMLETLTLDPIHTDVYRELQKKGQVGRAETHQNDRYKIENTAGQAITERLYEKLDTPRKRANFNRFVNLFEHQETLARRDRDEVSELLERRNHHLKWQILVFDAIASVYGTDWLDMEETPEPMTRNQMIEKFDRWYSENAEDVRIYLDGRGDLSDDKLAIFRRILEMAQQKLSYKHQRQGDGFIYVYWLDVETLKEARIDALFAIVARIKRERDGEFVANYESSEVIDMRDLAQFTGKLPINVPNEGFITRTSPTECIQTPF